MTKINDLIGYSEWVYKYYDNYKCIDRLLIVA